MTATVRATDSSSRRRAAATAWWACASARPVRRDRPGRPAARRRLRRARAVAHAAARAGRRAQGRGDWQGAGMSIRVLLVDDQALIRAGFRMILDAEEGIEVVGESA